jgi:glycosyltransferase involved in cell wall biosynthesis
MISDSEHVKTSGQRWVLVAGGFHRSGGMDRANAALAEYLLQERNSLSLVAHRVDSFFSEHPSVRVHLVRKPANSFLLGGFLLNRRGQLVARQAMNEPRTQVLVNGGNCLWPGVNWVHFVHHAWSSEARGLFRLKVRINGAIDRYYERHAIRKAIIVLANSNRTRSDLIQHLRLDPARVHTVYLGTDSSWGPASASDRLAARKWLYLCPEKPLVVFIGALGGDNRKGFDVLWSAWRYLSSRGGEWDADLVVAGDGAALSRWKSEVAKAGLDGRVRFLGATDRIKELLAAADLLVSPVRYEAYGLNVQEAICRGVPALVSSCAGVAERYTDALVPMLLSDPNDVEDLVRKLLLWRSNPLYCKQQFEPLGARLRRYTWADMAAQIVSIVETMRPTLDKIVPNNIISGPQGSQHSSARYGNSIGSA